MVRVEVADTGVHLDQELLRWLAGWWSFGRACGPGRGSLEAALGGLPLRESRKRGLSFALVCLASLSVNCGLDDVARHSGNKLDKLRGLTCMSARAEQLVQLD